MRKGYIVGILGVIVLMLFTACSVPQRTSELKSDFVADWDSLAKHQ